MDDCHKMAADYLDGVSCMGNGLHYDYLLDAVTGRNNYLISEIILRPSANVDSENVEDHSPIVKRANYLFRHLSIFHYLTFDLVIISVKDSNYLRNRATNMDFGSSKVNFSENADSFRITVFMLSHSIRFCHLDDFCHFCLLKKGRKTVIFYVSLSATSLSFSTVTGGIYRSRCYDDVSTVICH